MAPDDVWAVGIRSHTTDGLYSRTLIEHYDGGAWTAMGPRRGGPGATGRLDGVTALAPDDVWAAGWIDNSKHLRGLIYHWDGTSWTQTPIDTPDDLRLSSISADSPTDAWAVGSDEHGVAGVALHWDGTIWSRVATPPPGGYWWFNGVEAFGPRDAWLVGTSHDYGKTLTEHWDGSSWSIVNSPNGDWKQNSLDAVDATANGDIWTAGWRGGDGGGALRGAKPQSHRQYVLTEHWDGSAWSKFHSPSPLDPIQIEGLGAVSPDDVWAVGYGAVPTPVPVAQHWDGSRWRSVATPQPPVGAEGFLVDVDGDASDDAWAVGWSQDHGVVATWVQQWDGSDWSKV